MKKNKKNVLIVYRSFFLIIGLLPVFVRFLQVNIFEYNLFFILSVIAFVGLIFYVRRNKIIKNNALITFLLASIYSYFIFDWYYDSSKKNLSVNNLSLIVFLVIMYFIFFTRPGTESKYENDIENEKKDSKD